MYRKQQQQQQQYQSYRSDGYSNSSSYQRTEKNQPYNKNFYYNYNDSKEKPSGRNALPGGGMPTQYSGQNPGGGYNTRSRASAQNMENRSYQGNTKIGNNQFRTEQGGGGGSHYRSESGSGNKQFRTEPNSNRQYRGESPNVGNSQYRGEPPNVGTPPYCGEPPNAGSSQYRADTPNVGNSQFRGEPPNAGTTQYCSDRPNSGSQFNTESPSAGKSQFHTEQSSGKSQFHTGQSSGNSQFAKEQSSGSTQLRTDSNVASNQFKPDTGMDEAQFHADSSMDNSQFQTDTSVDNSQFHTDSSMDNSQFQTDTSMDNSQFHTDASMSNSQFQTKDILQTGSESEMSKDVIAKPEDAGTKPATTGKAGKKNKVKVTLHCELCKLEFSSQIPLDMHLKGNKHAKKVRSLQILDMLKQEGQDIQPQDISNSLRCEICGVVGNSTQQLQMHLLGSKHKSKCRSLGIEPTEFRKPAASLIGNEQSRKRTIDEVGSTDEGSNDPSDAASELQPPGAKFCKFSCKTCNVALNSEIQLQQHMNSKKHKDKLEGKKPAKKGWWRKKKQLGPQVPPPPPTTENFVPEVKEEENPPMIAPAEEQSVKKSILKTF